ncbi:MAG: DUF1361 domain-containing protein [Gammaproteobacteria bacterium]|nr:DUF1361 domain-containing protein [Gammaproteobacteria bacterium]
MIWNLFLAWLPYWFSLGAVSLFERRRRRWLLLILLAVLWLMFLPNAPYIMTDFIHLAYPQRVPIWYDAGLLAATAWTGVFLGVASLRALQSIVSQLLGRVLGWAFVLGAIGLSGLGVYLGRFVRWNSWDFFTNPAEVFSDLTQPIIHPIGHMDKLGFIFMFAALLLVCYLTLASAQPLSKAKRET